ncbi:MAG: transporter [Crocinitomicaceae bacterium]|nr:transporter [Crocinitomicaceae bacterium]|tara:strand:+ start:4387 stop:5625 length:1239 start_codon:yes stop_codon:yes gene_type:complete
MKLYILIITALLLSSMGTSISAQSLEESLKIAAENNPLLKAKYAEFEAAMQKVAQVNSLPDPTFSFGYFVSPVETRVGPQQAKLGLTQMFPWFGTLKTAGNVHALLAQAKYQEFINAKNELYMQVKSGWYPIYEVNQKIGLQKENRAILRSYKQLATTGFKNDRSSMVDVIRVDIMIENTDTEIKLLQDQLRPLYVHFNKLLNRSDSVVVKVEKEIGLIEISTDYRKDSLLTNHPLLQSLDLKMKSAQAEEGLSKKQGMPKFGIGMDYVFVGDRTDAVVPDNGKNVFMPMVSMSIPIYRRKYKAATKEAQFKQDAIVNYKTNTENILVSNYEIAWYELEKARQLIELYEVQISNTKQAISLLEIAYSNSGKDFEEILRMQQELLQYQIATATATKAFFVALAKLDNLTSKTE